MISRGSTSWLALACSRANDAPSLSGNARSTSRFEGVCLLGLLGKDVAIHHESVVVEANVSLVLGASRLTVEYCSPGRPNRRDSWAALAVTRLPGGGIGPDRHDAWACLFQEPLDRQTVIHA